MYPDVVELSSSLTQLVQFANEYRVLKETLTTMPLKLKHSIMVPLGSKAFVPGHIVRTNEVKVGLGGQYFVDRSCAQAVHITDRRIEFLEKEVRRPSIYQYR